MVIEVIKTLFFAKLVFSPTLGGRRFEFQVGRIVTLRPGLCKDYLPGQQFKICGAVNKEEAAIDYFTLFLAKIRLHRILALLPQGVWAKIGSYQILAGGKHKWAISSVIWKAKFWRSQKNMPACNCYNTQNSRVENPHGWRCRHKAYR